MGLCALTVISGCVQANVLKPLSGGEPAMVEVLFYACADNRDAENISADIRELMEGSPAPGYQFWILYDAPPSSNSLRPGLYRGRDGYWELLPVSSLGLSENLNMGDAAVLRTILRHVFLPGAEQRSVLILSGEGGAVYQGLILDQGSQDYLQAEEIAAALAETALDLLVMDSGFSAGFEFIYEIGKRVEDPPLMLLSPDSFPREGRNYDRLFSDYPIQTIPPLPALASHIRDEFMEEHASDPRSRQVLVNPVGAENFMENFDALLERVYAEIDTDDKRQDLRTEIMFADPTYYETPGNLHISLGGLLDSFRQEFGSSFAPDLMQNAGQSLSELYPDRGNDGQLSLFFVPLLSNGSPNPSYATAYNAEQATLAFVKDSLWSPDMAGETGLLYRLWLEAFP